jgi:hypothetical protein
MRWVLDVLSRLTGFNIPSLDYRISRFHIGEYKGSGG